MTKFTIRTAIPEDSQGLAQVRIETWQSAYRTMIEDSILDDVSYEIEAERWRKNLENSENDRFVLVGMQDNEVVGFCIGGPERDQNRSYPGEIYALYVLPKEQKAGLGKLLWQAGMDQLQKESYTGVLIWTLQDNHPARAFYEHMGGKLVFKRMKEIHGQILPEVGYGWTLSFRA